MGVKSPETARGNSTTNARRRPGNFQSPSARMNIEKYLVAQIKTEIADSDSKSGITSAVADAAAESTTAVGSTGAVGTTLDVSAGSTHQTNSAVVSSIPRQKENVPRADPSAKSRKRVRTPRKRPVAITKKSATDVASPGAPSGGTVDSKGHLITDYFQQRRSNRRTKAEVQKSNQLMMEDKIVREDETGFEIVKYEDKGRGVISTIEVKAGDFVLEYAGDLISLREARHREEQ